MPLPQERTQTTGIHRQGRPRKVVPLPIGITFCLGPRRPPRWASACIKVPPLPGPRKPLTQKSPRPGPRAYVHETGDAGKRIRRGGAGDHRRGKPLTQNSPRPSRTEAGETRARRHYEPQAQVPYKGNHTKADKHMNGGPGPPSVCKGNV